MNLRSVIASLSLLLAVHAAPIAAQEPVPSLPAIPVQGIHYVTSCDHRVLPSQRQVGEWTGQHNFSQVYDTRRRLMAEIGRVCQQHGVGQVQVVSSRTPAPRELRLAAVADRRGR